QNYLNIAYFGDGAYGISAAAKHYFSVKAADLTLTQAATLAGLVKNPVQYDPVSYPENALSRRNTVLATMEKQGEITTKEADEALAAPLGLKVTEFSNGCVSSKAPFFCDYVRRYLVQSKALGDTEDERQHKLETGGLTIHTTLDPRMQKATDKAVQHRVAPKDQAIGAQAIVQPGTGKVRALSQSRPMGNDKKKGDTYINYTVPKDLGGSNGFQAGSTFKVFTTAAALEEGYPTSTYFYSPEVTTLTGYHSCSGSTFAPWTVHNSTTNGGKTMVTGLQQSVNTYYAQLERLVGLCPTTKMAKSMGLEFPESSQVPAFTLGVIDVSPLEMAAAYATFPGRGEYCKPRPVTSIDDSDGKTVAHFKASCKRVIDKATADTVNEILQGVQSPTGFGAALQLNQQSAAKTGTTSDNKAVWYMGYTPNLVTASMIAGANQYGQPMSLAGQTLNGTYFSFHAIGGSSLAGPMWYDAMSRIQGFLPNESFHSPGSLGSAPTDTPQMPAPEPTQSYGGDYGGDTGGGDT
ncbi:MAG: transglycosylase domain-containing protein, partial [Nocardioidaceae bacterium]